jgi:selenocysteine lyase/cysteine desulfurase
MIFFFTAEVGMTGGINKFQRILERMQEQVKFDDSDKPVVFITHMEHHSNQTKSHDMNVMSP